MISSPLNKTFLSIKPAAFLARIPIRIPNRNYDDICGTEFFPEQLNFNVLELFWSEFFSECHQNSLKIRIGIPSGKAAGFAYRWYQISKWLFSFILNCLRILRVFLSIPTPDRRNQMALEWFLDSGIPTRILEECRYYVSASHSTSFDLRYGQRP